MNNNLLYRAALTHFESQKASALAILQIYFNTSVGVSEHSNHVEEVSRHVQQLSEAEDAIQTLRKLANVESENQTNSL